MAQTASPSNDPLRGIALRVASGLALALMTALLKYATTLGAGLAEIIFYRCVTGILVVLLWVVPRHGFSGVTTRRPGYLLGISMLAVVALLAAFQALVLLPLAESMTITFTGPVFATLLSWLVLREHVGVHRWLAAVVAFLGVVVVMRPGAGGAESIPVLGVLLGLGGALCTGVLAIALRHAAGSISVGAIVFWFLACSALAGLALMPFIGTSPGWETVLIILVAGVFGGLGQLWMTASLHAAPVAVLTPFDYLQLIHAVLLGWLLIGTVPTIYTWTGAALISVSGLYTVWREQRRRQHPEPGISN